MEFQDKSINCVDCAQPFVHSAADQGRYAERGLAHEPKRCPTCRAKRRNKEGGGQSAGGGNRSGNQAGAGGGNDRGGRGAGRAGRFFSANEPSRGRREFFPATCASCGCETTVPFRPVEGRPVFCRDCFQSQKAQ